MNFLTEIEALAPAITIATTIIGALPAEFASFEAGQPITVPEIKTYIAGQHVSIGGLTITKLP